MRNLIEKGKTIIFISHRLEEVFEIGDRVTVFKDGERVDTKLVSEIDTDELIRMMVGRSLQNIFPPKNTQITEEVLFEVKELTGKALQQVSFAVRKGEILDCGTPGTRADRVNERHKRPVSSKKGRYE